MKKIKQMLLFIALMITGAMIATSCSHENENLMSQDESQADTRAVGVKTPKFTTYIETNDVNPLNAGEYYFCGTNPREEVIDHVILFASNIRGTSTTVELYHNPNQEYILNNVNTLVAPLQQKGIKVLLGLLGDHTGVGFSNMTATQINSFAQQVANCVNTYGLDGVDFDDEYAEYWKAPAGLPTPSSTNFGNLILRLRQLLPGKMITAFHFGGYTNFNNQTVMNAIDYMWPDFGCSATPPAGLPNSKWAKLSVNYNPLRPTQPSIQSCANSYAGYGAIMSFNLRDYDCSNIMNYFASRVWNGRTVCHTGVVHRKNY